MKKAIVAGTAMVLFCVPLWGQAAPDANPQNPAMEQRIRELEDRVIALEGMIRTMQSTQAAQPQPAQEGQAAPATVAATQAAQPAAVPSVTSPNESLVQAGGPAGPLPNYGRASSAAKALNPDISAIGDFIGAAGGNTAPPLATLQPFPSLHSDFGTFDLEKVRAWPRTVKRGVGGAFQMAGLLGRNRFPSPGRG
jgi:hypothetical protein